MHLGDVRVVVKVRIKSATEGRRNSTGLCRCWKEELGYSL